MVSPAFRPRLPGQVINLKGFGQRIKAADPAAPESAGLAAI